MEIRIPVCIKYLKRSLIFLEKHCEKKKCSCALLEVQQSACPGRDGFLLLTVVCCSIAKHSPLWPSAPWVTVGSPAVCLTVFSRAASWTSVFTHFSPVVPSQKDGAVTEKNLYR